MRLVGGTEVRALVTGGTGFIGSAIVRELLHAGYDVRVLVRHGSDTRNLDGLDIERVTGDITAPASLRRAMRGCTHVFHAAALYSFWVTVPGLIERVNVDGTRNVLQAGLEAGIERVVYTSSVAALAVPSRGEPVDESTPVDPSAIIGAYKKSKYAAQQVALEYAAKGLPV
ncbi:MAG TPA: NAD-dependent epimerase/dehydratase family protein, partial [Candidatus Acetothermia bacterium]|nr:NAD-dependent epimerase/dehydratase family protein [Candidatus Acetothermia bacterium]